MSVLERGYILNIVFLGCFPNSASLGKCCSGISISSRAIDASIGDGDPHVKQHGPIIKAFYSKFEVD